MSKAGKLNRLIIKVSIPKKPLQWILVALLVFNLGLFAVWLGGKKGGRIGGVESYPELAELSGKELTFKDLSNYFSAIAQDKGAEYSFEVLKRAELPPNIDMHLLAHVVGDILFKEQGLEGISVCTHDFRNACSHSIVVGLFLEEGEGALDKIAETCRQAPGGSGAYTMCFHGLGHGVLAYTGYEMEKAVELCKKTGTSEYNNAEYVQCVGGVTMEMTGGVHDIALWQEKSKVYFKDNDPLYPCNADFMPDEVKSMCYVYLTPHLLQLAGADIGFPTQEDYKTAFPYCDRLPKDDGANRDACFGGFGKEFVVLAQDRDIRRIDQINEEQMKDVYGWCLLADNRGGSAACMLHAMNSLYWGGENDRGAAIRFCGVMTEPYYQKSCYLGLIDAVSFYIDDYNYREGFCQELPDGYREDCQQRLTLKN